MAKVKIVNVMFYGFHGIYEYEREQGQKFFFDIEVETKDDVAAENDDERAAVDTATIYSIVKEIVENQRFKLLQALGVKIGDALLARFSQAAQVHITIRKPSVPISGPIDYIEIEVTRKAK